MGKEKNIQRIGFTAWFVVCCLLVFGACDSKNERSQEITHTEVPEAPDFNFHVKPILSDRCFACHGPDANARKASLRLDTEAGAFAALSESEGYAIVAGNPSNSELVHRIMTQDPERIMPPPESEMSLTENEKQILIRWIEQGAKWKAHWAFLPIESPISPHLSMEILSIILFSNA